MPYFVYVLISDKDGTRYVGMTGDLERRLKEHNSGKSKFTKGHLAWSLVHKEVLETRLDARKREKYLKSGVGREFLNKLLASYPPVG